MIEDSRMKRPKVSKGTPSLTLIPLLFALSGFLSQPADAQVPTWDTIRRAGAKAYSWADIALAFTAEVAPEATLPNPIEPSVPDRPPFDPQRYRTEIDNLAVAAQAALSGIEDLPGRIAAFHRFFFVDQNFTYRERPEAGSLDLSLLDRVLDTRQGDEVGLGLVYLALAEKLVDEFQVAQRIRRGPTLPVVPVWAPDHLFLRIVAPNYRQNVELSRRGEDLQDAVYITRYRLPQDVVVQGVYLQDLDQDQMVGILSYLRGNLWFYRGEWDRASLHYTVPIGDPARSVRGLFPRHPNALLRRGRCRFELANLPGAEADFDATLNLIPHFPPAYRMRGRVYYDLSFHPTRSLPADQKAGPEGEKVLRYALRDLTAAIRLDPDAPEPYRLRARVLEALDRPEDAIADLQAFASRTPDPAARDRAKDYGREVRAIAPVTLLAQWSETADERRTTTPTSTTIDYAPAFAAVASVERLRSYRAVPVLIDNLEDGNVRFRWQVVKALATITGVDHGAAIDKWEIWWRAHEKALTPSPAPTDSGLDSHWPPSAP